MRVSRPPLATKGGELAFFSWSSRHLKTLKPDLAFKLVRESRLFVLIFVKQPREVVKLVRESRLYASSSYSGNKPRENVVQINY